MINYFTLITHHDPKKRKSFYERVQRPSLMLSIGWGEVNPIGSSASRIRKNIEENYDRATLNVTNGVNSLELFSLLKPGDIVFLRVNSAIIDVAVVTCSPKYLYGSGHSTPNDYCTKVSFVPLFSNQRFQLTVSSLPEKHRKEFIFNEGRSRTMKQIDESLARILFKSIAEII
jgi:hypothetical protein